MSFLSALVGPLISGVTSLFGASKAEKEAKKNRAMQQDAMENTIKYRVEDAQRAGVHPLYAIGAPTFTPSPITSGAGDLIASAGQDIGRAVSATMSGAEKTSAFEKSLQILQLDRAGLENELLRSQIAKLHQPGTPPSAPGGQAFIEGQGSNPVYDVAGVKFSPRKGMTPNEVLQSQYGEPADWLYYPELASAYLGAALRAGVKPFGRFGPTISYSSKDQSRVPREAPRRRYFRSGQFY